MCEVGSERGWVSQSHWQVSQNEVSSEKSGKATRTQPRHPCCSPAGRQPQS